MEQWDEKENVTEMLDEEIGTISNKREEEDPNEAFDRAVLSAIDTNLA